MTPAGIRERGQGLRRRGLGLETRLEPKVRVFFNAFSKLIVFVVLFYLLR
jgi:hypothetical protein